MNVESILEKSNVRIDNLYIYAVKPKIEYLAALTLCAKRKSLKSFSRFKQRLQRKSKKRKFYAVSINFKK